MYVAVVDATVLRVSTVLHTPKAHSQIQSLCHWTANTRKSDAEGSGSTHSTVGCLYTAVQETPAMMKRGLESQFPNQEVVSYTSNSKSQYIVCNQMYKY